MAKIEEEQVKAKSSVNEQIKDLEDELAKTKYNKRTQFHIGLVKAKIARLREKQASRSGGKKGEGYAVKKSGDATVVLLGFPSVGKSTLLNTLTNANSAVGHYAFTTLTVIPGSMEYKHAKIQILDVPGIVQGAAAGTGRGKEVLQVIRNANLVLIIVDVFHPEHYPVILKEVFSTGVRLNQRRPDIRITKTMRGGLQIGKTVPLPELSDESIRSIMKEFKVVNANVLIREPINADQLIDAIQKNCVYTNAITVLNKIDMIPPADLERIKQEIRPDLCISAEKQMNIPELRELIFQGLEFMRVYCKDPGKQPDMEVPVIIRRDSTVEEFAQRLHKDFIHRFRFARVWGDSVKFAGQKQSLKHVLKDKDIVELHIA